MTTRLPRLRTTINYVAATLLCLPLSLKANLGDTPEQIKARYGELVYKYGTESQTFRFRRRGRDCDTVDVEFRDGKSQIEAYHHWKSRALEDIDSTGAFPQSEIAAILKENSRGLTWRKQPRNSNDLPGSTTWLLGSDNPSTAVAKAVANNEHHSFAMRLLGYRLDAHTDAATAAKLEALFPMPVKSPTPVLTQVPLKPGVFPLLSVLGESQTTAEKFLGKPKNHRPVHAPDPLAGGVDAEYGDGTNWTLLETVFYQGRLRWLTFFFQPPPTSEDQFFEAIGLPKDEFQTVSNTSASSWTSGETKYRGTVGKRVINLTATQPGRYDPPGFCTHVDVELVDTLQ